MKHYPRVPTEFKKKPFRCFDECALYQNDLGYFCNACRATGSYSDVVFREMSDAEKERHDKKKAFREACRADETQAGKYIGKWMYEDFKPGLPDYELYLAYCEKEHPSKKPMTENHFNRLCWIYTD